MSYELGFLDEARKEWHKLDNGTRKQFKTKLAERLKMPRAPAVRSSGHQDRYKIKLRSVGYRLVYEVRDSQLIVIAVAVGKRELNAVYNHFIAGLESARALRRQAAIPLLLR